MRSFFPDDDYTTIEAMIVQIVLIIQRLWTKMYSKTQTFPPILMVILFNLELYITCYRYLSLIVLQHFMNYYYFWKKAIRRSMNDKFLCPWKKYISVLTTATKQKWDIFPVRSGIWTRDLLHPKQESYP